MEQKSMIIIDGRITLPVGNGIGVFKKG